MSLEDYITFGEGLSLTTAYGKAEISKAEQAWYRILLLLLLRPTRGRTLEEFGIFAVCDEYIHSGSKLGHSAFLSAKKGSLSYTFACIHPKKKHKNKSHVYLQSHFLFPFSLFVSNPDQQHTSFRLLGGEHELEIQERALLSKRPLIQYKKWKGRRHLLTWHQISCLSRLTKEGGGNQQVEGKKSSDSPHFYKHVCN